MHTTVLSELACGLRNISMAQSHVVATRRSVLLLCCCSVYMRSLLFFSSSFMRPDPANPESQKQTHNDNDMIANSERASFGG